MDEPLFKESLEVKQLKEGYERPILIRMTDMIDLMRIAEEQFMIGLIMTGLKQNIIYGKTTKKGKNLNDVYLNFHNNEQTRSTIILLQNCHGCLKNKKAVIIPELKHTNKKGDYIE